MSQSENVYAYIDGANLHKGIEHFGWVLDYKRFRTWLREKYRVTDAYLFLGFIPARKELYEFLKHAGYILVFKEITHDSLGRIKGNCDADLVLHATIDFFEHKFDKAIVISSDGDYAGLIRFFE